jgi:hypothetical protein
MLSMTGDWRLMGRGSRGRNAMPRLEVVQFVSFGTCYVSLFM